MICWGYIVLTVVMPALLVAMDMIYKKAGKKDNLDKKIYLVTNGDCLATKKYCKTIADKMAEEQIILNVMYRDIEILILVV